MCYYNGQKVTHAEFIRLKQLEKAVANYDFLNQDLQIGFDYSLNAVCKPIPGKEDFDIVQMELEFIPHYISNRIYFCVKWLWYCRSLIRSILSV